MHARPTHPTGTTRKDRRGWSRWHITWSIAIVAALGLALVSSSPVQARTFQCRAGNVDCLIASIKQANVQPGPQHEIRLEAGVYTLTAVDNSTEGPTGLPVVASTLTITGAGPDATVIERAASAPPFRLIYNASGGTLTLTGLTLTGGSGDFFGISDGGGILNRGRITITDSTLTGNWAYFNGGGAISNYGTLTITHSTLAYNGGSRATGGIRNSGTLTIIRSTLTGHFTDIGAGGILNNGMLTITNSTIADNFAGFTGGGITNGGMLTITNSTIANNSSLSGAGGIYSRVGTLTITNSTIADNESLGGFEFLGKWSGGLWNDGGTVVLQNTILARNTVSGGGQAPDCGGVVTSHDHNLIGDPLGCTITFLPHDLQGEPGLGEYTDDGAPGDGYVPLVGTSRAINAGNDATCPKTDQLGEKRVGICDIGAIEFQGMAVSSR